MATHLTKEDIYVHSIAWGLFSFCCFIILIVEFIKNTLSIADALALSALTVGFLIYSYYPISHKDKQRKPLPAQHKMILSVCAYVFLMSFVVRFGWL
ncbi:MAG: hypothetical protein Q4A69_07925 [Moraxella sp.]|nr:hypothetical protein [Moraxella sp.]